VTFGLGDALALSLFLGIWIVYNWFTDRGPWSHRGLSQAMRRQRERWMRVLVLRDLRMIDTAIMTGLQQGTGFFASSSIFAIGGCFALLGSADRIAQISADLGFDEALDRRLVEMKLLGLVVIFAYSFFKFAWSYRLFNYCSILIGAIPMRAEAQADPAGAERAVRRAAELNGQAAQHFNAGLRAIFFALAYLGWFLGPGVLVATTLLVLGIVGHRQFFSAARAAVIDEDETPPEDRR
jgi:uncharacterized membrane protein